MATTVGRKCLEVPGDLVPLLAQLATSQLSRENLVLARPSSYGITYGYE